MLHASEREIAQRCRDGGLGSVMLDLNGQVVTRDLQYDGHHFLFQGRKTDASFQEHLDFLKAFTPDTCTGTSLNDIRCVHRRVHYDSKAPKEGKCFTAAAIRDANVHAISCLLQYDPSLQKAQFHANLRDNPFITAEDRPYHNAVWNYFFDLAFARVAAIPPRTVASSPKPTVESVAPTVADVTTGDATTVPPSGIPSEKLPVVARREVRRTEDQYINSTYGGHLTTENISRIYDNPPPCGVDIHPYHPASLPQRVLIRLDPTRIIIPNDFKTPSTEFFLHIGRPPTASDADQTLRLRPHYWSHQGGIEGIKFATHARVTRVLTGEKLANFDSNNHEINVHMGDDKVLVCSPSNMELSWLPKMTEAKNFSDLFYSDVRVEGRRAITFHFIPTDRVWGEFVRKCNAGNPPATYRELSEWLKALMGETPETQFLAGLLKG